MLATLAISSRGRQNFLPVKNSFDCEVKDDKKISTV